MLVLVVVLSTSVSSGRALRRWAEGFKRGCLCLSNIVVRGILDREEEHDSGAAPGIGVSCCRLEVARRALAVKNLELSAEIEETARKDPVWLPWMKAPV